ncbi:MAG TPA: riboflavin synthase [Candidatus Binataceae bacterium]|nr:riboflavin synthase [Candidatus Binataceae bacterium]
MFTGIIEDLGTIQQIKRSDDGAVISIRTGLSTAEITIGESIAVSGCCLTVVRKARNSLSMDVSAETLRRTTLGGLKPGDRVNLERCLTLNKLLGGHLVSGHVDGIGRIASIQPEGDSRLYTFEIGAAESRYLIEKGSVALDGISLTVFGIRGRRFNVALIPHTLKMTTLGYKKAGSAVNVESDMLVKYVERMLGDGGALQRKGDRDRILGSDASGANGAMGKGRRSKTRPVSRPRNDL